MKRLSKLAAIAVLIASITGGAQAMEATTAGGIATGVGTAGYVAYRFFSSLFDVNKILYAAGKEAAILGIHQAPAADQQTIARDTVKVTGVVLAWLPNNADQNAAAVNQFIVSEFAGVPWLMSELQLIAPTVERYIPVSTQFLSPQVIKYITNLLTGIRDGAGEVLDNPAAHVKPKYTTEAQREHERGKIQKARAKLMQKRGFSIASEDEWFRASPAKVEIVRLPCEK